ncbi:hypothetical protein DMENIID0001_025980 [Sergentomyia squamirostris]
MVWHSAHFISPTCYWGLCNVNDECYFWDLFLNNLTAERPSFVCVRRVDDSNSRDVAEPFRTFSSQSIHGENMQIAPDTLGIIINAK